MSKDIEGGFSLPYRFTPREYQYPFLRYFDQTPNRQRAFLLAHRRTGKDLLAWNNLIKESQKRVGTYWHVLPLLNQARKVIWTGCTKDGIPFLDFIPPPLIKSKRDDDMSIRLKNGSLIQLVGADRIDSLMGSNPVGVNLSEFALMKPSVWDYLSPILNENDGWACFVTTPRGRNHAFDLFKSMVDSVKNKGAKYFIQVLTVDDTRKALTDSKGEEVFDKEGNRILIPVIPPEAIQEQRDLNVPEEIIQQEYYCSFEAGLVGSYYGATMRKLEEENKTKPNPRLWDPKEPVYTAWDIGISDFMAIWYFQYKDGNINIIEYNEFAEKSLAECCCLMRADFKPLRDEYGWSDDDIQKAMAQFGHHAAYKFSQRQFGPHDINTRDVATGVTRKNVARKYGVNFRAVPKTSVSEGIDLVRRMLLKATFDGDKCLQGIRALKEYHKEWDDEAQMYKDKPVHDWSSHGCDAFRYLCQGIIAFIDGQAAKASKLQPEADHNYNPLREKAIRLEERELRKLKRAKRNANSLYSSFANTDYDLYRY